MRKKLENENREIPKKFSMLECVSLGEDLGEGEIVHKINKRDLWVSTAQKVKKDGEDQIIIRTYYLEGLQTGIHCEKSKLYKMIDQKMKGIQK